MYRFVSLTVLFLLGSVSAAEPEAKLKALWTTGGCCHNYKKHSELLPEKIGKLAGVKCDVVFGTDQFKNADYAKNYDLVVYDLCYASEKNRELIDNITRTHREGGKPAVIVHCSLHTFRDVDFDDWRQLMGMTSKSHDKFRALETVKVAQHPATRFWPEDWKTPGDELYQTIKMWPTATPLLVCRSVQSNQDHVVCWVNQYGKARVFATTLGHDLKTVEMESYHQLLANGLLWVCGKLSDDGKPLPGFEGFQK